MDGASLRQQQMLRVRPSVRPSIRPSFKVSVLAQASIETLYVRPSGVPWTAAAAAAAIRVSSVRFVRREYASYTISPWRGLKYQPASQRTDCMMPAGNGNATSIRHATAIDQSPQIMVKFSRSDRARSLIMVVAIYAHKSSHKLFCIWGAICCSLRSLIDWLTSSAYLRIKQGIMFSVCKYGHTPKILSLTSFIALKVRKKSFSLSLPVCL